MLSGGGRKKPGFPPVFLKLGHSVGQAPTFLEVAPNRPGDAPNVVPKTCPKSFVAVGPHGVCRRPIRSRHADRMK
jgi:hypothetical protein